MLRFFWGALALACGVVQVSAGSPAPVDDSSAPMRFEWRREGPPEACGSDCRMWISATGYITADTPREFETFAKDSQVRGAIVAFDSDGGSVLGTLALGRMIRSLDMVTTIGKTTPLPGSARDGQRATLSPNGNCESMCAFLLLAGSRRYVPPEAHVLVHQKRDIGRLAQYTIEMGGGVDLLETALRIPPWEPLYRLSSDELRRMNLITTDTLFAPESKPKPSVSAAASLATVGRPGDGRSD
jgi:hypothetical protein